MKIRMQDYVIFFIFIFISSNVHAITKSNTFRVLGRNFEFVYYSEVWISEKCIRSSCEAKTYLKDKIEKINRDEARDNSGLATSPGSYLCTKKWAQATVIGRDTAKNGRAFCIFSDASMIEINSLTEK